MKERLDPLPSQPPFNSVIAYIRVDNIDSIDKNLIEELTKNNITHIYLSAISGLDQAKERLISHGFTVSVIENAKIFCEQIILNQADDIGACIIFDDVVNNITGEDMITGKNEPLPIFKIHLNPEQKYNEIIMQAREAALPGQIIAKLRTLKSYNANVPKISENEASAAFKALVLFTQNIQNIKILALMLPALAEAYLKFPFTRPLQTGFDENSFIMKQIKKTAELQEEQARKISDAAATAKDDEAK